MSPDRPVDADGFSRPHVSARLPPPGRPYLLPSRTSILCQAVSSSAWLQAATCCQGRWIQRPGRSTQAARPPYHVIDVFAGTAGISTAHPNPPGDDETKTVVPSRRHPQSIDAAARDASSPSISRANW